MHYIGTRAVQILYFQTVCKSSGGVRDVCTNTLLAHDVLVIPTPRWICIEKGKTLKDPSNPFTAVT